GKDTALAKGASSVVSLGHDRLLAAPNASGLLCSADAGKTWAKRCPVTPYHLSPRRVNLRAREPRFLRDRRRCPAWLPAARVSRLPIAPHEHEPQGLVRRGARALRGAVGV